MSDNENPAVDGQVERRVMPCAWAVFAPNGNVRLWATDSEPVRKLAEQEGLPLVPLYAIPDGYVLVPAEPTPEMLDAANQDLRREYATLGLGEGSHLDATKAARNYYAAMLAAAPDLTHNCEVTGA